MAARDSSRRHRRVNRMDSAAWILVGMMGVGKSTVGQILANLTGRKFEDTDRLLVQRFGRPVPHIFKLYGEVTFRDHETSILKGLSREGQVISTGGGIVLREANWQIMRNLGTTIFLDVPLDVLTARLRASKKPRPLLQVEDVETKIREILEARRSLYEQADIIVQLGSATAEPAAQLVLAALGESA